MPTSQPAPLPPEIAERIMEMIRKRIDAARYRDDPVAYGEEKLGLEFTEKQREILRALAVPPHRVMVKSANNSGKSFIAAFACVWFYDTRDPASVILTAPTFQQVNDVTFKEVRRLMGARPDLYPKNPRVQDRPGHLMVGLTAGSATAFQGRRERSNLIVFEECMGIGPEFWTAARYMLSGGQESYWLSILNPTDNTGHAYSEEMSGGWHVISISAFEHPNIVAELAGLEPPIPAAVRLGQLKDNLDKEGTWVSGDEAVPLDVDTWDRATYDLEAWPEGVEEGARRHFPRRFWRPGPIGEARILGRYPTRSASAVFSEAAFDLADGLEVVPDRGERVVIGCDVARFGDDDTSIHVRRGRESLEHLTFHGQDTAATAGKLKELCRKYGEIYSEDPTRIRVNVDDDGVGGGVCDQRVDVHDDGREVSYSFVPVSSARTPAEPARYPNVRSELLFNAAEQMAEGGISLKSLPPEARAALRHQALQVLYRVDARGRRVVELKAEIKKRLGRSPDDLDAFTLAYYSPRSGQITGVVSRKVEPRLPGEHRGPAPSRGPLGGIPRRPGDPRQRS